MSATDKRHNVKLETLTPVHIGSGLFLQNNIEFVKHNNYIYIIDPRKLIDIIGIEKLDYWVSAINRGDDIKSLISKIGKNSTPDTYSKRYIATRFNRNLDNQTTLKECMHDGRGIAYIPGSSIKGAIRTAVFADIATDNEELENLIDLSKKTPCEKVEKRVFGKEPKSNVFRFLQIGDAYFNERCEVALNEVNLNVRESHTKLLDESKKQLVEAIEKGSETTFTIKLLSEYNKFAFEKSKAKDRLIEQENKKTHLKAIPENMQSLELLFETININSKVLIESEINIWEQEKQDHNDDSTAQNYIDNLKDILQIINKCGKRECVLRVGQASGWRFMTGAWVEINEELFNKVITKARPNAHNYTQYDFPKSRRIGDEYTVSNEENEDDFEKRNDIFGFVKLTLQE